MEIDNILMLIAAVIERANLDVGLVSHYDYDNRISRTGVPRICAGDSDTEHQARICARKFLDRLHAMRIAEEPDMAEICMEVLSWRLLQNN